MTILTTSIPDVIDALLALIRGLKLTIPGGTDPVDVFDGLPGPNRPDYYVQVGGIEQNSASGTQDWHSLGAPNGVAPSRDEHYTVDLGAFAFVGGAAADTLDDPLADAQKVARDAAFTMVRAIETGLRDNPKLATVTAGDGLLSGNGLGTGWVSFGTRIDLQETTADSPRAGMGREAAVIFAVDVFKRLFSN